MQMEEILICLFAPLIPLLRVSDCFHCGEGDQFIWIFQKPEQSKEEVVEESMEKDNHHLGDKHLVESVQASIGNSRTIIYGCKMEQKSGSLCYWVAAKGRVIGISFPNE